MRTGKGNSVKEVEHRVYFSTESAYPHSGQVRVDTTRTPWSIETTEHIFDYESSSWITVIKVFIVRKSVIGDWMRRQVASSRLGYDPVPGWITDTLNCVLEVEIGRMIVE